MTIRWTHKDLDLWQRALDVAELTYVATRGFPVEERFGLAQQMRKAAVSVLSNIAEGAARRSRAEFLHFLSIARGSLAELDAQLTLAGRLQMLRDGRNVQDSVERVGQMLTGLMAKLRTNKTR